jgi:hypothetical protein
VYFAPVKHGSSRLPTGERLDLPMSPQLKEIFRVQGVPDNRQYHRRLIR